MLHRSLFSLGNRRCPSCRRAVEKEELDHDEQWRCRGCGAMLAVTRAWTAAIGALLLMLSYGFGYALREQYLGWLDGVATFVVILVGVGLCGASVFDTVFLARVATRSKEGSV